MIALTYDGIVIDAEEYASGQSVTVQQWNDMFVAIKAEILVLIVTLSHFSPYGTPNGNELVADWLSNPNIDYLSPQLYTTGTEPQNDWEGFDQAWVTASTPIAPSIVQESYYDQLGSNSVTAYLPNAKGYLVWSNTAASQPGTAPTCVNGYFPVRSRVGGIREVGLSELAVSLLVNGCGGYASFIYFCSSAHPCLEVFVLFFSPSSVGSSKVQMPQHHTHTTDTPSPKAQFQ